jgi:hypothetical protein
MEHQRLASSDGALPQTLPAMSEGVTMVAHGRDDERANLTRWISIGDAMDFDGVRDGFL